MSELSDCAPNELNHWHDGDSETLFKKQWKSRKHRNRLIENGYSPDTIIKYQTDHYGLRNQPNVDISNSVLTLGCSYTFGTGLDVVDTWTHMLGESTYNAGIPGSSNDTAFRVANYLIPKYKPNAVFLLSTFDSRYEFYYEPDAGWYHQFYHYAAAKERRVWVSDDVALSTDLHDTLNRKKNILAIKCLCNEFDIPFAHMTVDDVKPIVNDLARDLSHAGRKTQAVIATEMKNHFLTNKQKGCIIK